MIEEHSHKIGLNLDLDRLSFMCSLCGKHFEGMLFLIELEILFGEKDGKRCMELLRDRREMVRRRRKQGEHFEGFWYPKLKK